MLKSPPKSSSKTTAVDKTKVRGKAVKAKKKPAEYEVQPFFLEE